MKSSYNNFIKNLKEGTYTEHYPIEGNKEVVTLNYCTIKVNDLKNPYLIECRGITFNRKNDRILCRGIHKFFNVGENSLSTKELYTKLYLNEKKIILEKLDGTMVVPFIYKDIIYFKTKRVLFEKFLMWNLKDTDSNYHLKMGKINVLKKKLLSKNVIKFSKMLLNKGMVPIFEYIGPRNKIVVMYKKEMFVLIAIRKLDNGAYLEREFVEMVCKEYNIDCVKIFTLNKDNKANFEGVVEFFPKQNIFFKIKTEWYKKKHIVNNVKLEDKKRFFVNKILNLKIDDFKPYLNKNECTMIEEFEKEISDTIEKILKRLKKYVEKNNNLSNKELASKIKDKRVKNVIFKIKNNIKFNTLILYRNKEKFLNF